MATLRVQPVTLSTGTVVRIVDLGVGQTPRYVVETPNGQDAMSVTRWETAQWVSQADFIASLIAVGFLAA